MSMGKFSAFILSTSILYEILQMNRNTKNAQLDLTTKTFDEEILSKKLKYQAGNPMTGQQGSHQNGQC